MCWPQVGVLEPKRWKSTTNSVGGGVHGQPNGLQM